MNPLAWKREFQVAAAISGVAGAIAGIFFAWMESPFRLIANSQISGEWGNSPEVFLQWLAHPHLYWVWPLFGGAFAILAFYAFALVTNPVELTDAPLNTAAPMIAEGLK